MSWCSFSGNTYGQRIGLAPEDAKVNKITKATFKIVPVRVIKIQKVLIIQNDTFEREKMAKVTAHVR